MVKKLCKHCGEPFETTTRTLTCSEECRDKEEKLYQENYRMVNWMKWKKYRKDAKREKMGTGDLLGEMHRNKDGSLDFEGEALLLKKEMIRIGLLYPK